MLNKHGKYDEQLKAGQNFEDFVARELLSVFQWHIHINHSLSHQLSDGESLGGVEVKLDRVFERTHNLYIEVCERHIVGVPFKRSGMYGKCHWLAIGNENKFWVFSRNTLCSVLAPMFGIALPGGQSPLKPTNPDGKGITAYGLIVPLYEANKYCSLRWPKMPTLEETDGAELRIEGENCRLIQKNEIGNVSTVRSMPKKISLFDNLPP